MRTLLALAIVVGLATTALSADTPKVTGTLPYFALAQATSKDGKGTLTVKKPVQVCKMVTETVLVEILKKVDGKDVKAVVPKEVTKVVCMTVFVSMEVRLGDQGVSVSDATGKVLTPSEAVKRLEKETAILIASGGPADPIFLQTTKPDTLVLVMPLQPEQFAPPAPSGKVNPTPPVPVKVAPPAK